MFYGILYTEVMQMKKTISILVMILVAVGLMIPSVHAAKITVPVSIGKTVIDGVLIEDTTFVPFDTVCEVLGASRITWDPATDIVAAECRGITVASREWASFIEANGRCFYTGPYCRSIGGMLYVPIRPLAKAFDADVIWHEDSFSVTVVDHGRVCKSGDEVYPVDAVKWLSRIIYAEANIEPMQGKLAVGNVIMNRVASSEFPNTIYGVIFDRKFGTQFTPVANGMIYNSASDDCRRAAMLVLEGYSMNGDALYFMNAEKANNLWVKYNRPYLFTIGEHSFYA